MLYFDPLILAFSRREKGLASLNLMAVMLRVGTMRASFGKLISSES